MPTLSPIGTLFVLIISIIVTALVGIILLFALKNKGSDIMLWIMCLYAVVVAVLAVTAYPSHFTGARVLAGLVGLCALLGVVWRYTARKQSLIAKLLVSFSVVVGVLLLIVF